MTKLNSDINSPSYLTDVFLKRLQHSSGVSLLRFWNDECYLWDGAVYVQYPRSDLMAWISKELEMHNLERALYEQRPVTVKRSRILDIIQVIKGRTLLSFQTKLNSWLDDRLTGPVIIFENGIVQLNVTDELKRPKLIEHTPQYFSLVKLPYNYDPNATCPNWTDFLYDVMNGDGECVRLLRQWAGYLLMPTLKFHKFLLISGEGQNGKTVFTTLLDNMLGCENVSHVSLSMFGKSFSLAATLGKVMNSTSESSSYLDEFAETALKSFVSGDRMEFERKYKDPIEAYPTAKVMISTNQKPNFQDKSIGIWRRLLYVPFEKNYAENVQDKNLTVKLLNELPGIFNWAVTGMFELENTGHFIEPRKCMDAIEQYKHDVNPARAFLLENYTPGLDCETITCEELYNSYKEWCFENGYKSLNNSNFGKELRRTFPSVKKSHPRESARRVWTYNGIATKNSLDEIPI